MKKITCGVQGVPARHMVVKLNLEQNIWCLGMEISFQGILGIRLHVDLC